MWLDWRSGLVDLYLGQGLAILQSGKAPSVVVALDAATPAEVILRQLSSQLKTLQESPFSRRSRCRVWLSAALCPAISITFPQGLQGWRERRRYGQSLAAEALGLDAEAIAFEIVDGSECIAAAMAVGLRDSLAMWAHEQGWKMELLSPLWSAATRLADKTGALIFTEPDSVSVFAVNHVAVMAAKTWPKALLPDERATANRWLATTARVETSVKSVRFTAGRGDTISVPDPIPLNRHWGLK